MRRPSSIEPFTPSPTVTLHPLLQSVLDNLDIQIDEELTRYRRQRRYPTGGKQPRKTLSRSTPSSAVSPSMAQSGVKSFDLKFAGTQSTGASPSSTAIGILDNTIQRPTPRSSIYAEAPMLGDSSLSAQPAEPIQKPIAKPSVKQAAVLNGSRRSFETPIQSPVQSPVQPSTASSELELSAQISSYAEQNDLSVYAPNDTLQKLMQRAEAQSGSAPEDYLASSEELLRSIAEEDVDLRAEREPNSMLETLLTPLGVGSMLLLLLSSTTLGYVIMNPASLGWWTASRSQAPASSTASPTSQEGTAPSPDLASEEFVDLGLDTLSTLPKPALRAGSTPSKTTASPKPSTASTAAASNGTANKASRGSTSPSAEPLTPQFDVIPVAPVPQPSLSTVVVPSEPPVIEAPEPEPVYQPAEPAPLPPEPAVSPEPITATPPALESAPEAVTATAPSHRAPANPENYYYVVTEYSGDSSLEEARDAIPDAYVRNLPEEGAKVQMGAFSEEARAQELLQELENQGIEAEVYRP